LVGNIEDELTFPSEPGARRRPAPVLKAQSFARPRNPVLLAALIGFETLSGILARLQRIPQLRDSFEYEGRRYTVEELEGHRIARVRIEKTAKVEGEAEAAKGAGD
jgi:CBS domain containing-hemolysin-like protein